MARMARRSAPAEDLELTIDVFIFWFGFWFFEKIFPGRLFFFFFGFFRTFGRLPIVCRVGVGLFCGLEVYGSGGSEQLVDVCGFLFRPIIFREEEAQLL